MPILAQLSDLHILERGRLAFGEVDAAARLTVAIRSLLNLPVPPDAVILTGDLTDHGEDEEYENLASLLSPLPMPWYLMPGNHDDTSALRRAFSSHRYLGTSGPAQFAVPVGQAMLIALDTTLPRATAGALDQERLDWLSGQLDSNTGKRIVVAMHHPPFRTLIDGMDNFGLVEGASELEALISRHPNVERVICGHLHRPIEAVFGGTLVSSAPSTAHQIHLDVTPGAPLAWTQEPPAFRLHCWDGVSRMVTHTVYTGDFGGPRHFRMG